MYNRIIKEYNMKNKYILGALLICITSLFTACTDDNDSNPTLIQPTEFVLNTPAYANETVDLQNSTEVPLTWSQPKYTADNAPINATYEVQLSPTNSFTVSKAEADADENGEKVADYVAFNKTTTKCNTSFTGEEINKTLINLLGWTEETTPSLQDVYVRVVSYIAEGTKRLNPIESNSVKLSVKPYFTLLEDVAPIMWYIVGNNIGDGSWSNKANTSGVGTFPMFLNSECTYDKTNGQGEVTYLNYFDTDGWKLLPVSGNWDFGFMGTGTANEAIYRDGKSDTGNIFVGEAGYYLVTVNTKDNTCSIVKQDITPTVYNQICIIGTFDNWTTPGENMTPVNKVGENHVWFYELTVAPGTVEQIKFKVPENWDTNWGFGANDGDISTCGKATNGGKNIGVGEGTWYIMFNDITGEFSITEKPE